MKRPPLNDINNNPGLINLGPIPSQAPVASFNINQIESLIRTKGFVCIHYKHAYNPNSESVNSPVLPNNQAAFRGLRYYDPRPLYHVPQGFKMEDWLAAQAIYEKGSVLFNISGQYYDVGVRPQAEDNPMDKVVHLRSRDLLVFPTLTDMSQQKFEYNPTGPCKLQYKAKGVDFLFDSERDYVSGRDYSLNDLGQLVWLDGGLRPDFRNGKGAVCSIVYYYTPIYIVWDQMHHLRVIPSNDAGFAGLPRLATYAPQQIVCKPSSLIEEADILDWSALPPMPEYPASANTTGGST